MFAVLAGPVSRPFASQRSETMRTRLPTLQCRPADSTLGPTERAAVAHSVVRHADGAERALFSTRLEETAWSKGATYHHALHRAAAPGKCGGTGPSLDPDSINSHHVWFQGTHESSAAAFAASGGRSRHWPRTTTRRQYVSSSWREPCSPPPPRRTAIWPADNAGSMGWAVSHVTSITRAGRRCRRHPVR
jgi:hypothetical protein